MKNTAIGFLFLCFLMACSGKKDKAGYVITQKVFAEFHGTKDLQNKFSGLQNKQKHILDSLALDINGLEAASHPDEKKLHEKKRLYNQLLTQFGQDNATQDQQYTEGVWKQINQYTGEFGKEKGYSFIYGATGTGNLMYADSTYDVTSEVIEYINKKYDGK